MMIYQYHQAGIIGQHCVEDHCKKNFQSILKLNQGQTKFFMNQTISSIIDFMLSCILGIMTTHCQSMDKLKNTERDMK